MSFQRAWIFATLFALGRANGVNTPSPMQTPTIGHCEQFGQAAAGESCDSLAARAHISTDDLVRINPGLVDLESCQSNILAGYWYCFKEGRSSDPFSYDREPLIGFNPGVSRTNTWLPSCSYGSCWKSFVDMSTGSEPAVTNAMSSQCIELIYRPEYCVFDQLDLPEGIRDACSGCDAMASACPCYTRGMFHTVTGGLQNACDVDLMDCWKREVKTSSVDAGPITAAP